MRKVKFKVVRIECRGRRYSAFAAGKYNLEYPEGEVVRAIEGTLGVAVFRTRKQAKNFRGIRNYLRVIHVCPIGRGRTAEFISDNVMESGLDYFYDKRFGRPFYDRPFHREIPPGTIFYPAVEVLD